ncbi:hypothetical protein HHI36_023822, partial [Cryptolaemus montrouzieri]
KNSPKSISYNKSGVKIHTSLVVQCYHCLSYGHTQKLCRGNKRYRTCGMGHVQENYEAETYKCFFGKENENHESTNRMFPEYTRQKLIREKMAVDDLSYFEEAEYYRENTSSVTDRGSFPALSSRKEN